ncbi:hypothetical protein FH972_021925 [Carpinus fangiana]|uniref:non-specific serine/threonine protein kinase n=1 Tax=Carpinus fangiana TaxID=176857 RepID=A0A5N6KQR0_9ROSI|nr:hypothetical protein FH972_021925 [Carpinus fangiana]
MSAAASPMLSSRTSTSSRRDQSYEAPESPRRRTSSSSRTPTASSSLPYRAQSTLHTGSHPPSAARQAASFARRDQEQSNVNQASPQRRSISMDRHRSTSERRASQDDAARTAHRSSSRSGHSSRYVPATTTAAAESTTPAVNGTSNGGPSAQLPPAPSGSQNTQQPRRRTTVEAQTGVWSLGKTIGAGSMGKVKLARNQDTGEQAAIKIVPRHSQDDHRSQADRERADHSKEVRTAREAAIVTLVSHPYICGMRDVVRTNYHWYMLFEYVNGGQMLDYIISHGKLKEKQARKFGRQIASALDYCHRNSIVHRDLKIENILISKTGDIKIIDFGLSNLFSPRSQLKTFCGSLYFAAPELLQAKQYTGPEVDVWSFGIVLYVLVCGKVPFDDQSMPQLHAKIKKGLVEYPPWLSAECKHIISRMLVTNPAQRASLSEIMNHPWMTKGYGTAPDNCLPHREPLQLPLDSAVVEKMTGFDFGSSDYITRELEKIILSEEYQKVVRAAAHRPHVHLEHDKKRSGMFDFYQRRKSASSRDALATSSSDTLPIGEDPVNAYSPLISIYYLVREKQERERLESNPGALTMPQSPGQSPLKMPDLPVPEAAHTNTATPEMTGEAPTGGRSRPRARTNGEDEIATDARLAQKEASNDVPPLRSSQVKKESAAAGILRRFSTRKRRDSDSDKQRPVVAPSLSISKADEPSAPRHSFNMRKTRDREPPPSAYHGVASNHPDLLAPPGSADGVAGRRLRGLGRSTSVNSGDLRRRWSRRGVSEGSALRSGVVSESEQSSIAEGRSRGNESESEYEKTSSTRLSTARTKSVGHQGRDSMQTRRHGRGRTREDDVPEETDAELAETNTGSQAHGETMKPVYLKGLFSVSTTSNKPLSFIRNDIIRVLEQLGVDYREMKGGFACRHQPSIDLNKVVDPTPAEPRSSTHRRKISFAGLRSGDREYNDFVEQQRTAPPSTPRSAHRRAPADLSYQNSEQEDDSDVDDMTPRREVRSPRAAGETTTHVQSDLGQSLILKFEILVVKVPFLSLHGLQFKKVDGGTWQYKKMADAILSELKL